VLVTDPSARMVSRWIVPFAAVGDDVELPCVASLRRLIMTAPRIPFSSRLVGMGQLSEPEGPVSEKEESSLPKSWRRLPWERTGRHAAADLCWWDEQQTGW
jgi:hypothetical protein